MSSRTRRHAILAVCVALLCAAGTAWADDTASQPLKITHFMNWSWFDTNQTTILKALQAKTNTVIELQSTPSDDNQKLNLIVASGNLPDLISMDVNDQNVPRLIKAGLIYDIGQLIDAYEPDIRTNIEPEYFQYHRWTDGKNYYFTNYIHTKAVYAHKDYVVVDGSAPAMKIRGDVFEAIGKPDMSTPDGFFNALVAIKQKFPGMVPFYCGPYTKDYDLFKAYEWVRNYFMLSQFGLEKYTVKKDVVTSTVRDPKFLEAVKYMNKLYTAKLLEPESFADTADMAKTKLAKGNIGVLTLELYEGNTPPQDNPNTTYVNVPYFKTAKVVRAGSGGWATVVSKKTKDPARIMEFIRFCTSMDGRKLLSWGIEGQQWEYKDGKPGLTAEAEKQVFADWSKYSKDTGCGQYVPFQDQYIPNLVYVKYFMNNLNQEMYKKYFSPDIFLGRMDPTGDLPEGQVLTRLREYATSYYPKMIMAADASKCESIYKEFLKKCVDVGLDKVEKYWTARYTQFK